MTIAITCTALLGGCTRWGSTPVYGPPREVERRLLGEPSLATTSSSSLSAGFAGFSATERRRRTTESFGAGGVEAETGSITRTHCVQQAEIHYEQPYELHAVPDGRVLDVAGGVALGVAGLSVMLISKLRSSPSVFEPGDPFYEEPPSATPGYMIGGGLIAGGLALVGYSFGALPRGPKPPVQRASRAWVETQLVEATGCR